MNFSFVSAAVFALATLAASPTWADAAPAVDRSATGGAQTLQDIMARQSQLDVD